MNMNYGAWSIERGTWNMEHGAFSVKRVVLFVLIFIFGVFVFGAGDVSAKTCKELSEGIGFDKFTCIKKQSCTDLSSEGWLVLEGASDCVAPTDGCCAKKTPLSCLEAAKETLPGKKIISASCISLPLNLGECDADSGEVEITMPNVCQPGKCCAKVASNKPEPTDKAAAGAGGTAAKSGSPITLFNPLGSGTTIYTIVQRAIQGLLGLVGAAALLVFLYAGVMWMTAGSSERIQKAKDAMKYAVIGLFMIAFAYAISTFMVDALVGNVGTEQVAEPQYAKPAEPNE